MNYIHSNITTILFNGTSYGLHKGHAYFIFDLINKRVQIILLSLIFLFIISIFICTIRIMKFIFECEIFECCWPSSPIDQKILMELSTRSSDGMLNYDKRKQNV